MVMVMVSHGHSMGMALVMVLVQAIAIVYFDQLSGAARTQKLVEILLLDAISAFHYLSK